jgi:hypothetical protein
MTKFRVPRPEEPITGKFVRDIIRHYHLDRPKKDDLWRKWWEDGATPIATRDYIYGVLRQISRHYDLCYEHGQYGDVEYVDPEHQSDDFTCRGYYEYARKWAAEGIAWAEYTARLNFGYLEYVGEMIGLHGLEGLVRYVERITRIMVHRQKSVATGHIPYIINSDPDFLRWYVLRLRKGESINLSNEMWTSSLKYWAGVHGVEPLLDKVVSVPVAVSATK